MAMTTAQQTDAYRFFSIAFDAAPGVTYMNQLADAYAAGMTTKEIVNVFTTKDQFTNKYPKFLSNESFASSLIANVVGTSATDAAKAEAAADVAAALNAGWSRGDVIYQVFTNLAGKAADDATWGNTAKLMANKVAVAKYVTETALTTTTDLAVLSKALAGVTATTDVSTPAALVAAVTAVTLGSTYTLTVGADTITGTSGNDTINALTINATTGASATTLGSFDSIDGGAGNDTLNIYTEVVAGPTVLNSAQQGTIKNVEIINVFNGTPGNNLISTAGTYGGTLDASKFVGATQVWQDTGAADVSQLADGVTAGLRNLAIGAFTVETTDAATTASVALKDVEEGSAIIVRADSTNAVNGKLSSVTISGNAKDGADAGTKVGPITEVITAGFDVQTVTLNTAVDATLFMDNEGGKAVSTLAAGASTGAITHNGSNDLATITTGAGKDDITLNAVYATAAKAASVTTGAGDDKITVNADNNTNDVVGTTLTVSAGDGKDTIALATVHGATNAVTTNVNAGAGDDTVSIQTVVATTDVIDGSDGTDTVELAGQTKARIADDYIVLTKVLKNFEAVTFTTAEGAVATDNSTGKGVAEAALDASKLTNYKTITFDNTGVVTKLAADQTVVLNGGAVSATASGYISTDTGATTKVTSTTYAGTVNAKDVSGETLTAKAETVKLAVTAADTDAVGGQTNVASTLTGDVKSAVVTLTNGQDIAADGTVSHDNLASITIVANSGAAVSTLKGQEGAATALGAMTSLTLTGDGSANVTNTKGALATVDASGLGGTYTVTADGNTKGDATLGLTYSSSNANAETIKLGSGIDDISLGASTYGKVDTVEGLNLVLENATTLAASSDTIAIAGVTLVAASKGFTTTQTDLDLALKDAAAYSAANGNIDLVFVQGGATYLFSDAGSLGLIDAADTVVKLVGTVSLDALIVAL